MLSTVPVTDARRVDDYVEAAGAEAVSRLRAAAAPLAGSRLLNVSSTAFGGGVAELVPTQVALMRDLGIDARWKLFEGSGDFFAVTKAAHNGLQGGEVPWTTTMERTYLERIRANASEWSADFDFVLVHDPQPAALLTFVEDGSAHTGRWMWRCHIQLSQPQEAVWRFFAAHVARYDAVIFTAQEFVQPGITGRVALIPPSIDPLAPKNAPMDTNSARAIVRSFGVDTERPIVTQVSRFDPWKDPLGVIDAYRLVKRSVPTVQLVMIGSLAHDDPEGMHYLELTERHRGGDPDVHILTNLQDVGQVEVNAFQRASDVILQKSLREGFGLTASEAMWKERPVVAGAVGGLKLQVRDGTSGYLVDTVEDCADRTLELLHDPALRVRMGKAGREEVRRRFLSTREVEDHLNLMASLR